MSDVVTQLTGTIPVIVTGSVVQKMSESMLGKSKQVRRYKKPSKKRSNPFSAKNSPF